METTHRVDEGDARDLPLPDDSVELVVTSPPYPMVEMWDDLFADLDGRIGTALDAGEGDRAFDLMHDLLGAAWDEVARVLVDGGVACVNVGDATRTLDRFRVYPNHARVTEALADRGLDPLPDVVWRKPANSAAKFMGSGMVPPNAYVTLEHEHVLVFRNGARREFPPGSDRRYEAAYFWEERNRWFSDVWTEVRGELQTLDDDDLRERSGAYPFEVPYRLINMYSTYGDTVLDPFWGTGTTSIAAMVAARNSVGVEREGALVDAFADRIGDLPETSRDVVGRRLDAHAAFVERRRAEGESLAYETRHYDLPVRTRQERRIRFYAVEGIHERGDGYVLEHAPVESRGTDRDSIE